MRRRALILLVVTIGLIGLGGAGAWGQAPPPVSWGSGEGLTVTSVKQLDQRLYALTVTTAAIPATLNVRILLPAQYASSRNRRYPVLYLLHGTSGTASNWTTVGDAESATAGQPLIVVMPDIAINDGGGGWCTNWPNGAQAWDTFHIHQLIPWVDAHLRTLTARSERAIAGLSQGGFCSMSYAARYPQLFGEALSFSGAPDIAYDVPAHAVATAIINATEVGLDHVAPDTFFGNPLSGYLNWADHDPATLVGNLRNTKMYIYFGNGVPGPLDSNPVTGIFGTLIESLINADNQFFHQRLLALGITPAVYDAYGRGTHSWPYWNRDLSSSIGPLMADFAAPQPLPSSFSYETADPSYSLYGWSVQLKRVASEFSTLTVAGKSGFTLAGSGMATVSTAPLYARRAQYTVTTQAFTGTHMTTVRSSRQGALTLPVYLGPSDTTQQYSIGGPPSPSPGTTVYTTRVSIARA
jgi:S-formylglutathione hydrolase FrmB